MIRKTWYAVAKSDEVTTQPMRITIHGQGFVIYRGENSIVYAFDANCPHRGCDLSMGCIRHGELQCPYHGWRFNSAGRCTHIPANRAGVSISPKFALASYPTIELAGLVWMYTWPASSTEAAEKFSTFSELESQAWLNLPFEVTWDAHFSRVVESVMDVSHLPFVHPEQTGDDVIPVVGDLECNLTEDGIIMFPTPFAPMHPMEPKPYDVVTERRTEIELRFPNQWMIRSPMGEEASMCTFLTFTPIDDETTKIYGIAMRNFDYDNGFLDVFHIEHTQFVMDQDRVIVESLYPRKAPFDLKEEFHVASDRPTILFRNMLKQAVDRDLC